MTSRPSSRLKLTNCKKLQFKLTTLSSGFYSAIGMPGSLSNPIILISKQLLLINHKNKKKQLTSVNILPNCLLNHTLIGSGDVLRLEVTTRSTEAPVGIHGLLESISLPAKDVVAVLAVPGLVAGAEDERLRAVGWPVGFVVEFGGVPDDLLSLLCQYCHMIFDVI